MTTAADTARNRLAELDDVQLASLELDLASVAKLITDGLLSVAVRRLDVVAATFELDGVTYVATDINRNVINRTALTDAEATRQLADLACMGYRSVRTEAAK